MVGHKLKIDFIIGHNSGEMFGKYRVYQLIADSLAENIDINEISYKLPKTKFPYKNTFYSLLLYPKIVKKVSRGNADIVCFLSQEETHLLNHMKFSAPVVIICLDIIPYLYKNKWNIIYNTFINYSYKGMKEADQIIAISQYTKNDLMKYFNIPEEKITVIYLGVDNKFTVLGNAEIRKVRKKYNLPENFVLYVGSEQPRKNLPFLIKAFNKLLNKYGASNIKLVKVGRPQIRGGRKKLINLTRNLNIKGNVGYIDYVPDEDLPKLYNAANLFVFPSLHEGFGLPPLEAMACGTPVITLNTSSLPEVVGDAGIMVDPYDVDGLAETMYKVLTNDRLKEDMIKKGLERAKMFSWEKCARETLKIYKEVYYEKLSDKE